MLFLHLSSYRVFHQTIARFLLIIVLVASSFSCTSSAKIDDNSTKTTVYYAGFGFMGRFDNIAEKFPHAARLNQQKGRQIGRLTAYFTEQLKQQNFNNIVVNFNSVDQNRNRPLMLAMSVERETLSLDRGNNPIVEISAQLLFFDYESRVLLGNLHIPVAFKGIKGADNKSDIEKLFEQAYFSKTGLFNIANNKLKTLALSDFEGIRLQVASVSLEDGAKKFLPQANNQLIMEEYIGQYASAMLGKHKVNIIPFSKGATIGRQMAIRLNDTSAFNLVLPKADYELDITLQRTDLMAKKHWNIYGVKFDIAAKQSFNNKSVLNMPLFYTSKVKANTKEKSLDQWAPFEDAIESSLADWAKQFANPSSKWCKRYSSGSAACAQLKKFKQTLSI